MTDFDIKVRRDRDAVTVVVEGELDVMTTSFLRQELLALEAAREKQIIVELSGIRYIDSTGVREIVNSSKRNRAAGRQFWIGGASPQVEVVLSILGLGSSILRAASAEHYEPLIGVLFLRRRGRQHVGILNLKHLLSTGVASAYSVFQV